MRARSVIVSTVVLALLGLCGAAASANVIVYNNFGPDHNGWDYNWGLGWTVAGENNPTQYGVEQALAFAPSDSGPLSDIWLPIWRVPFSTEPDEVTIRLTTNPNNEPPQLADVLEQWVLTDFPSWSAWSAPHHLVSSLGPQLDAGKSYWLWASGDDATWCGWCMNVDPAYTLPHTMRREGENWLPIAQETASAFRVDVVPEPGCLSMLLVGGALLLSRRR